eukprot:scaffold7625_cov97-Isochrysis_galbana.AAC.3
MALEPSASSAASAAARAVRVDPRLGTAALAVLVRVLLCPRGMRARLGLAGGGALPLALARLSTRAAQVAGHGVPAAGAEAGVSAGPAHQTRLAHPSVRPHRPRRRSGAGCDAPPWRTPACRHSGVCSAIGGWAGRDRRGERRQARAAGQLRRPFLRPRHPSPAAEPTVCQIWYRTAAPSDARVK